MLASLVPVGLDLEVKHRERNVFGGSAGLSEFLYHMKAAVSISRVDDQCSGAVQLLVRCKPFGDRVTGSVKVVVLVGLVMMREEIVIKENHVECRFAQDLLRLLDGRDDLDVVTLEPLAEPAVAPFVIVEDKDLYRIPLCREIR